jgi:hypothetical protein
MIIFQICMICRLILYLLLFYALPEREFSQCCGCESLYNKFLIVNTEILETCLMWKSFDLFECLVPCVTG